MPKYADEHLAGSLRQLAELLVIVWCQKKTLEMQKKLKKEELEEELEEKPSAMHSRNRLTF